MKAHRHINIIAGRVQQIEQLAKARFTTIAGAVESLVADRVAAGEIEAGFPAFQVDHQGAHVVVVLDGVTLAPIPAADAATFAQNVVDLASKTAGRVSLALTDGGELLVARSGHGFRISAAGARFNVSGSMLREIAGQLQEAAR